MTNVLQIEGIVTEGSDFWVLAAIGIPRAGYETPVMLTVGDVSGVISFDIFEQNSPTPIYSTTFSKTLSQDGGSTTVIHAAAIDKDWGLDDIGHCFSHKVREQDTGAGLLKGSRRYSLVYRIPTVNDGTIRVVAELEPESEYI